MDASSSIVAKAFDVLGQCNAALTKIWLSTQKHPNVISGAQALEIRPYNGIASLEGYVDVELKTGKSLCWWVEVNWDATEWRIKATIRVTDTQGQFDIAAWQEVTEATFDGMLASLHNMVHNLERTSVDLDSDPPFATKATP